VGFQTPDYGRKISTSSNLQTIPRFGDFAHETPALVWYRAQTLVQPNKETTKMQEQYVAPELKLVGNAADVVLGSTGAGGDYMAEAIIEDMEFEAD
jgi:hypothetical protein